MGDASIVLTKTNRREIMSVVNGDSNLNRYQVYRGLSPDTCNRLEIKIQSLEEELQAERKARLAAHQQCTYLTDELQNQNEHYDGMEEQLLEHVDLLKSKDQELQGLRQNCKELAEKTEVAEISLRKKHQDVINELNEQIDHLIKQRNRSDAEKKNILLELGELNGNLEKVQAAKAHLETKLEANEADLRRLLLDLDDKSRQILDLTNSKTKLIHDNGECQSRIKMMECSMDGLSRDKVKNLREIENLKSTIKEAESEKLRLISASNLLQVELNDVKAGLEDEHQRSHLLLAQLHKVQNDFTNFKNKAEKDLNASNDENEAIRKKYIGKISELEDCLNHFQKKSSKVEKEHSKLIIEIRELTDELEKSKTSSIDLLKKLKCSESMNSEHRYQIDQLTINLKQSEGSVTKFQAELTKLKSLITEKDDKYDILQRELKLTSDRIKEYKEHGDKAILQVQELLASKMSLEREVTRLKDLLTDTERKALESRKSLEVAIVEAKQFIDELNVELRLKEEEVTCLKKTNQKHIEEHQYQLIEFEARHKTDLSRAKKLFEAEILEISASHDSITKAHAELTRANKTLVNRVKELEVVILNEERIKEDLKSQINSVERRRAAAQADLDQLSPKLDSAEHSKKMAELAIHELEQRVSELSLAVVASVNDAKRHEAEANSLRTTLEEVNNVRRDVEDKLERLHLESDATNESLNIQMELGQEQVSTIKQLEKELKETRSALEEVEQNSLREGKKLLGKVQARCKGIEIDLETEQRKSRELQVENKRLHRLLQEISAAKDNDVRELVERTNQLESAQAHLARLKKQLLEAEEVVTVVTRKYRRLQHQIQEVTDQQQQPEAATIVLAERSSLPTVHLFHQGLVAPLTGGASRVSIARSLIPSAYLANKM